MSVELGLSKQCIYFESVENEPCVRAYRHPKVLYDPRVSAEGKRTPLHWACIRNDVKAARGLLERGHNVFALDPETGLNPLGLALEHDSIRVSIVISEYLRGNMKGCGPTYPPLHRACIKGDQGMVLRLLERGHDVRDPLLETGETPLRLAIEYGHKEILEIILRHLTPEMGQSCPKHTPLHSACLLGELEAVRFLLSESANLEAFGQLSRTPLVVAILARQLEVVKFLLDQGANLEAGVFQGVTPLFYSCFLDDPQFIELLLDRGANLEARTSQGDTILLQASKKGFLKAVAVLLERGADQLVKGSRGLSALEIAYREGEKETGTLLYCYWPSPISLPKAERLYTFLGIPSQLPPLELALRSGHLKAVSFQLCRGAQLDRNTISRVLEQDLLPKSFAEVKEGVHQTVLALMLGEEVEGFRAREEQLAGDRNEVAAALGIDSKALTSASLSPWRVNLARPNLAPSLPRKEDLACEMVARKESTPLQRATELEKRVILATFYSWWSSPSALSRDHVIQDFLGIDPIVTPLRFALRTGHFMAAAYQICHGAQLDATTIPIVIDLDLLPKSFVELSPRVDESVIRLMLGEKVDGLRAPSHQLAEEKEELQALLKKLTN